MSTNHNRIKVSDLETNGSNKILTTNSDGELEFSNIENIKVDSYNGLDYNSEGKALDARQGKILKNLIDNLKDSLKSYFDALYLGISNDQNVLGIKTFFAGKLGLRNVANTVTSFFTNANTASRTYTLQNRDGILLDNTDLSSINSSLASKQSVFSGAANFIAKSLNSTTLISSRLFDNGTYFGIGTYMTPTKDVTLGNQANRIIGVEESNNVSPGRNLKVTAGRTINFIYNNNFNNISQPARSYWQIAQNSLTNDIYVGVKNGFIYVKYNDSADFVSTGILFGNSQGLAIDSTGVIYRAEWSRAISKWTGTLWEPISSNMNWGSLFITADDSIYATLLSSDDIYFSPAGGSFTAIGETPRLWSSYFISSSGTHYASVRGGGIYRKLIGETMLTQVYATAKNWTGFTELGGDIIACADVMYRSVGGMETWEVYDSNINTYNGIVSLPNRNIYATSFSGIFLQINDATGIADLDGGTLDFEAGTGKGTGKSRIHFNTGQKVASGIDMQNSTLRAYIDENGYMIWLNMPIYANNAEAIAGGLPIGCEYKTATGDRKIVY